MKAKFWINEVAANLRLDELTGEIVRYDSMPCL